MILTTLDLEFNQPSGRIIQIGAVAGDTNTGEIINRRRIYVTPDEPIDPYITDLCGITQAQIDELGVDINVAYALLKDFHLSHSQFINPLTWGGDDSDRIKDQISDELKADWCFGRRCIDAKTVAVSHMIAHDNKVSSGGLASTMKRFGLKFIGKKHDAQDDAENTFRIYHHMIYLIKHGSF